MARITVEDCLKRISNRYELALLAAWRARKIAHGAQPTVAPRKDHPAVIALREVAAGAVDLKELFDPGFIPDAPMPGNGRLPASFSRPPSSAPSTRRAA